MKLKRELSLLRRQEVKHCVLDDSFGEPPLNLPQKPTPIPSLKGGGEVLPFRGGFRRGWRGMGRGFYFHFYFHFNFRNFRILTFRISCSRTQDGIDARHPRRDRAGLSIDH